MDEERTREGGLERSTSDIDLLSDQRLA